TPAGPCRAAKAAPGNAPSSSGETRDGRSADQARPSNADQTGPRPSPAGQTAPRGTRATESWPAGSAGSTDNRETPNNTRRNPHHARSARRAQPATSRPTHQAAGPRTTPHQRNPAAVPSPQASPPRKYRENAHFAAQTVRVR